MNRYSLLAQHGSRSLGSPDKAQRAAIRGYSLLALRLAGLRFRALGSPDKAQRAAIRGYSLLA
ncbi:hypothetical protein LO750_17120, partial [Klebsiella aerogenes]|uniref:hypothetical protein n=1 Tax=Klebsiella aerogenes TaxID=548 RepID=UPI001E456694